MAWQIYRSALRLLTTGEIDFDTDSLRIALVLNSYTVDLNAHTEWADASAHEAAATAGYTTGGKVFPGASEVYSNKLYLGLDAGSAGGTAQIRWTVGAGGSLVAGGAIVYKVGTVDSGTVDPLIAFGDFGLTSPGDVTVPEFYNLDINFGTPYGPNVKPLLALSGGLT